MKKNILLIVFALCLFMCDTSNELFAQGASCVQATQLCDDPACGSFDIGSGQGVDPNAEQPNSSCLEDAPNATWFFLIDDQGGGGTITIANNPPACDTDFAAWGPFDSPADALAACAGGISTANEVGCDFEPTPGGVINMPGNSQVGDVYLMVITNFSDDPGITVTATTAIDLQCCPVATGSKADVDVCSGDVPTAVLADFEGAPGEVSGSSQFLTDLGLSTSATALVAPTAADFENTSCDTPFDVELYYLYECDANCDAVGDGPTVVGSFTATVYPDVTSFVVTETPGACGTAAMVSIATAGGTVCFTDMGTAPMDMGCGTTDDQSLTYSYDPSFPATCNVVLSATVAAECVGAACGGCVDPCFVEYDPAVVAPGDPADCITPVGMTACDDNNPCTVNDMEVLGGDGVACVPCAGTPVDCATAGETTVQACDDSDPCTAGDMETVLNCDGSVCVPCAGTPVDCATPGEATSQSCDDGDPCTINDVEVILLCDGSICTPCAGTVVTPPIPALTCPPAELNYCDGSYDCMFMDSNVDTDGNGVTDAPIVSGTAGSATSAAGVIDLTQLTPGATYTITLNYEEAGCFGTPVTCTFTVVVPNDAEGGQF